ncbi:preprotein translocase subunit SecE [Phocoenobacter skyensis]|uniref:Protein translocase subunit SecE n=1 Tax=Phocoenobacter skyensis TaxID=97481 RepID=A0A1H7UDV5_9PAST|nr:preprotein translocase subunit SecE [Pasteurella skyensis]MDP8080055.1 preprotein translocase subunit SecE [Pasteurella skyensis]MDP8086045.1 preprotein translocase subunit SecE [Pasteurella skyensis]MDP8162573.1 preprotein translocase subunit SecE [Pasteurella skyensis]MDP8169882.1 preprotein translocase subunit SecE [Pasteurella skyensis]MDP8172829.1 preprotein translocase subunit SecE [Pasteurella skyensis]
MANKNKKKISEKTAEITLKSKGVNTFLWVIAITLLAVAAVGNVYFSTHFSLLIRTLLMVGLCLAGLVFVSMTNQGDKAIGFFKESRLELRKIIWPNRQEATQTTFIVIAITVVVSLALWAMDSIIVQLVTFLTELRF